MIEHPLCVHHCCSYWNHGEQHGISLSSLPLGPLNTLLLPLLMYPGSAAACPSWLHSFLSSLPPSLIHQDSFIEPTLSSWPCARCGTFLVEKMWPFPGQGEASKAWSATVPVRCGDKEGLQGSVGGQEGSLVSGWKAPLLEITMGSCEPCGKSRLNRASHSVPKTIWTFP